MGHRWSAARGGGQHDPEEDRQPGMAGTVFSTHTSSRRSCSFDRDWHSQDMDKDDHQR